ncbi:MAG: DinB family protein [Saprospiraceae bacterium]
MNRTIEKRLDRMDTNLRLLFKDLETYTEDKLNEQPEADKWSVFQVLHHMIKVERGSMGYVNKKLSYNPELKKAGFATSFRSMAAGAFTAIPIKIKAPAVVAANLPTDSSFWEVVKLYKETRGELRTFFANIPDDVLNKEVYKHPIAGRMTLFGMLSFLDAHFNRHRKQIKRTLKKVDAVKQV